LNRLWRPLLSSSLHTPVGDEELSRTEEVAQFLAHSSMGNGMNYAQRTRLAAQLRQYVVPPFTNIVDPKIDRQEMFIIQSGTVEVWSDPDSIGDAPKQPRKVTTLKPGEMTGELSMIDEGVRTADLITSAEGAIVLALDRQRLLALREDDPELGSLLLWNTARAMAGRVRYILWQLQRAQQRANQERKRLEELGITDKGRSQDQVFPQPALDSNRHGVTL
jgi:CRP-like cAMP-binding protein